MSSAAANVSCERARLALSLALDGEASGRELFLTALHLGTCAACRAFAVQLRAVTAELRSSTTTTNTITRGATS